MAARFNRHRPALCAECSKPLSVRERRVAEDRMLCAWDAYQEYRKQFEQIAVGGWSEPPVDGITGLAIDDLPQEFFIDPFDLFGLHGEEGDLD